MKRAILAAAAMLTLLTADLAQAQSSSRQQPVRRTTTQSWHRTTTTRTNNGRHTGLEKGKHKGWEKQTGTVRVRHGGYHRQRPR